MLMTGPVVLPAQQRAVVQVVPRSLRLSYAKEWTKVMMVLERSLIGEELERQ